MATQTTPRATRTSARVRTGSPRIRPSSPGPGTTTAYAGGSRSAPADPGIERQCAGASVDLLDIHDLDVEWIGPGEDDLVGEAREPAARLELHREGIHLVLFI